MSSAQTDGCGISISFDLAALSGFTKSVDVFQLWMTNNTITGTAHCALKVAFIDIILTFQGKKI